MTFTQLCPENERNHHLLTINCVLCTRSLTDLISFLLIVTKTLIFAHEESEPQRGEMTSLSHSARKGQIDIKNSATKLALRIPHGTFKMVNIRSGESFAL